jgi:cation diffusion facilitator family transporter
VIALWALTLAARPPDDRHAFGYTKAEYFSSGVEGFLIIAAPAASSSRHGNDGEHPQPLTDAWTVSQSRSSHRVINGGVALLLLRAAKRLHSITLRADGYHLLTDVWTSAGVIVGIVLVALTGWVRLDPLIAFGVAVNIVWTGWRLVRETGTGLLDAGLPDEERTLVDDTLAPFRKRGVPFPRSAHASRGDEALRIDARARPRRLVGPEGPRPVRGNRGSGAEHPAADDGVHAPGAEGRPGEL